MGSENGGAGNGRLSRDLICEAALEAIDSVGLEAVSMRMLAASLGVKASSLYHHFESKEQLMTGVAEFLYRNLGQPPDGRDWAEQVKGTFLQLRDFIQEHPKAAPLLVHDLAYSPVAKKRAGVLLRLVCRAGLDPATSASLLSNLVALLVGHALLGVWIAEETGTGGGADETGRAAGDESPVWVHKLFRWEYPNVSEAETGQPADGLSPTVSVTSDLLHELPLDSVFCAGLDALISGFVSNRD